MESQARSAKHEKQREKLLSATTDGRMIDDTFRLPFPSVARRRRRRAGRCRPPRCSCTRARARYRYHPLLAHVIVTITLSSSLFLLLLLLLLHRRLLPRLLVSSSSFSPPLSSPSTSTFVGETTASSTTAPPALPAATGRRRSPLTSSSRRPSLLTSRPHVVGRLSRAARLVRTLRVHACVRLADWLAGYLSSVSASTPPVYSRLVLLSSRLVSRCRWLVGAARWRRLSLSSQHGGASASAITRCQMHPATARSARNAPIV